MAPSNEQIFEFESITQPSYWGGQIIAPTGLKAMDQIVATGANTVTIIPNFFQTDKYSNSVALKLGSPDNPWSAESDSMERVEQSIRAATDRGLKVVLKPHLETNNRVWRAELAPSDPKAWFASYKAMMVEYAKVAQKGGAAMICVGTEMDSMISPTKTFVDSSGVTKTYTQAWGEIIDAVRAVYSGKVTYAATYWTAKDVGFWDKVDYIGVDAYLPMTPKHAAGDTSAYNPTVQEMVDAWTKPHFNSWVRDTLHGGKSAVDYYKGLSEQYGKKVVFTEVGYRSLDGTSTDPGVFGGGQDAQPDFQEQVDCYTALFKVMENYGGQWLAGSFLWSYYSFENPMEEMNVSWTDYTTQWKPANAVVTANYSSPAHETGLVWTGTSAADKLDGGYHNDTLTGAGGNDTLRGGAGDDSMSAGDGNDRLTGGAGDDVMDGGIGQNTAVYAEGRASYTVLRASNGNLIVAGPDGTDILSNVQTLEFAGQSYTAEAAVDGSGPTDPTGGGSDPTDPVDGGSDPTDPAGGGSDPTVPEHAGLILYGTRRANTLTGSDGNDIVFGLGGNDKLRGGAGDDRLYGGTGKDVLTGGAGADVFVFDAKPTRSNVDRISDFNVADDSIWLDAKLFRSDASFYRAIKKGSEVSPLKMNKKFFTHGDHAKDTNDHVFYDKKSGILYYDPDGNGVAAAVEIAHLKKHLKITDKDFFFV
jgi:Ca2+-binding RTX toxin-like protein